jgi:hypothetical protein
VTHREGGRTTDAAASRPHPSADRRAHCRPGRQTLRGTKGSLGARAFVGRSRLCGPAVGGGRDLVGRIGARRLSVRLTHMPNWIASQPPCSGLFAAPVAAGESILTEPHAAVLVASWYSTALSTWTAITPARSRPATMPFGFTVRFFGANLALLSHTPNRFVRMLVHSAWSVKHDMWLCADGRRYRGQGVFLRADRATHVPHRTDRPGAERTATVNVVPPMSCPCPLLSA